MAQVEPEQARPDAVIAAVQHKQDAIMGMLENIMSRLEKLEARTSEGQSASAGNPGPRAKRPVVCHNCKQEGHYARGCAAPSARTLEIKARHQSHSSQSATPTTSMVE